MGGMTEKPSSSMGGVGGMYGGMVGQQPMQTGGGMDPWAGYQQPQQQNPWEHSTAKTSQVTIEKEEKEKEGHKWDHVMKADEYRDDFTCGICKGLCRDAMEFTCKEHSHGGESSLFC